MIINSSDNDNNSDCDNDNTDDGRDKTIIR